MAKECAECGIELTRKDPKYNDYYGKGGYLCIDCLSKVKPDIAEKMKKRLDDIIISKQKKRSRAPQNIVLGISSLIACVFIVFLSYTSGGIPGFSVLALFLFFFGIVKLLGGIYWLLRSIIEKS